MLQPDLHDFKVGVQQEVPAPIILSCRNIYPRYMDHFNINMFYFSNNYNSNSNKICNEWDNLEKKTVLNIKTG